MKRFSQLFLFLMLLSLMPAETRAKIWTLQSCIDYALANNIDLRRTVLQKRSSMEDVKESQAMLLPSLSVSTSQNGMYQPWPEKGIATQGFIKSSVDKAYYNGSYNLNGSWTVWNGNRNINTIKLNKIAAQRAELDSATLANQLIEQIAQLYIQILYTEEAIKVSKASVATSRKNEERGKEFVAVNKMSKADLSQLTARRSRDEYDLIVAQTNLKDFQRQLKQLLQLTTDEPFEVAKPMTTDEMALRPIPSVGDVYNAALAFRPEIASVKLALESSELNLKMAKAYRLPSLDLNFGLGTSTTSMSNFAWTNQMRNNLGLGGGVTLSIPLFDNRRTTTAVNKALIEKDGYLLDLREKQTKLYSDIENCWLQGVNNQNRFKAAKVSTQSAKESFELLSAKFEMQLINVVELMKGRDELLTARQNELQAKYLAILNLKILDFYKNGILDALK